MAGLEEKLGELTGQLRALIPALRSIEQRLNEGDKEQAALKENVERLREWVSSISLKVDVIRNAKPKSDSDGIDWRAIIIWLLKGIGTLLLAGIATAVMYYLSKGGK